MRYLGTSSILVSMMVAACASNPPPPAASSESVAQATSEPNTGPDFTPASSDGLATAKAERRLAHVKPRPDAPIDGASSTAQRDEPKPTWGTGSEGGPGVDPATANAAGAPRDESARATTDADNSRINQRDRAATALTPMDQGPSESDRRITQQIRQEVMRDKTLSFTAKNVKIITVNGKVTLRGPVKSEAERSAIEAVARRLAGSGAQVDSQLELAK